MDRAGWNIEEALDVPPNMRIVFLPLFSPELNPAERIWKMLREGWFANSVFKDMRAVVGIG